MTRDTDPRDASASPSERHASDGEDWHPSVRTDGSGATDSAAGADEVALDPWGSSSVADYRKLFEEFGIAEFEELLDSVPNPHYLMRRGVIFGHRDYDPVAKAMR